MLQYFVFIIHCALGASIVSLGNRAWGSSSIINGIKITHIAGAILMTMGFYIGSVVILHYWTIPILFGCVMAFRIWADGYWLDEVDANGSFNNAVLRTIPCFVLASVQVYFSRSYWPIIKACAASYIIPMIYRLSSKQKFTEPVALSECLSGYVFGVV